jgi:hypothetical protein
MPKKGTESAIIDVLFEKDILTGFWARVWPTHLDPIPFK